MRRRNLMIVICLLLLGIGTGIHFLSGPAEPSYNGHKLSYWLQAHGGNCQPESPSGLSESSGQAIALIGPEAVPFLLQRLVRPPTMLPRFVGFFTKGSLYQKALLREQDRIDQAYLAYCGLQVLGTNAGIALPALESILHETREEPIRRATATILGCIGPQGIRSLGFALTDPKEAVRVAALQGIQPQGTNALPILPSIVERLAESSTNVLFSAASALYALTETVPVLNALVAERNRVFPLLQKAQTNSSERVSEASALVLERLVFWQTKSQTPIESH